MEGDDRGPGAAHRPAAPDLHRRYVARLRRHRPTRGAGDLIPPPVTTRFAPSPTGELHLGHAVSAWQGWRRARAGGGRFLLRIEDIDSGRCRPEHAAAIEQDLRWLGLDWNGPVRTQSAHMDEYRAALAALDGRGLLYPCFCTRAEIARALSAPHADDAAAPYPGACRALPPAERTGRLASGAPHALRLDMRAALRAVPTPLRYHEEDAGWLPCDPAPFGDVVIARKDQPASYHLCVAHDDAIQGVTLVTRGMDLRPLTAIHRLLQALMNWPAPAYAHHPLSLDARGRRLAKRRGAPSLRDLRRNGMTPAEAWRLAGVDPVRISGG